MFSIDAVDKSQMEAIWNVINNTRVASIPHSHNQVRLGPLFAFHRTNSRVSKLDSDIRVLFQPLVDLIVHVLHGPGIQF